MKTLKIPFIEGLETLDYNELDLAMETGGAKGYIDTVNWPDEYPYMPDVAFSIARSSTHIAVLYHVRSLDLGPVRLRTTDRSGRTAAANFSWPTLPTGPTTISNSTASGPSLRQNAPEGTTLRISLPTSSLGSKDSLPFRANRGNSTERFSDGAKGFASRWTSSESTVTTCRRNSGQISTNALTSRHIRTSQAGIRWKCHLLIFTGRSFSENLFSDRNEGEKDSS